MEKELDLEREYGLGMADVVGEPYPELDTASDSDAVYVGTDGNGEQMCPGCCGRTHKECIAYYDAVMSEDLCDEEDYVWFEVVSRRSKSHAQLLT